MVGHPPDEGRAGTDDRGRDANCQARFQPDLNRVLRLPRDEAAEVRDSPQLTEGFESNADG